MTRNELKDIIKECIVEIREDNEVIGESVKILINKEYGDNNKYIPEIHDKIIEIIKSAFLEYNNKIADKIKKKILSNDNYNKYDIFDFSKIDIVSCDKKQISFDIKNCSQDFYFDFYNDIFSGCISIVMKYGKEYISRCFWNDDTPTLICIIK